MSNLLDIYKVYSLEKIAALNKQSLAMQYEQCGQLVALQKQLKAANSTSREILRNQVKELERQEKGRYFKNLIFNINEVVEKLENIDDNAFCYFVCSGLLTPMNYLSKECLDGLEDLQDKGYAKQVIKRIESLQLNMNTLSGIYIDSCWHKYEELKAKNNCLDIDKKIKELEMNKGKIEKEIKQLQQELTGLFSIFMSNTKKERYNHTIEVKKERISSICEDIDALNIEKMNISKQFNEAYQHVNISRPGWEKEIDEMTCFLPKQPSTLPKQPLKRDSLDYLFEEVAIVVVKSQTASTSMIQQKFSIGYNRAGRIMDQMERGGIVGPTDGSKPRLVLVDNLDVLEQIINSLD